jgi:hypothetical protein
MTKARENSKQQKSSLHDFVSDHQATQRVGCYLFVIVLFLLLLLRQEVNLNDKRARKFKTTKKENNRVGPHYGFNNGFFGPEKVQYTPIVVPHDFLLRLHSFLL